MNILKVFEGAGRAGDGGGGKDFSFLHVSQKLLIIFYNYLNISVKFSINCTMYIYIFTVGSIL